MSLNEKLHACECCLSKNKDVNTNALYNYIGYYTVLKVPEDKVCLKCGNSLKEYNITKEEFITIYKISNDRNFLDQMIQLKETDLIEFQLKMSQFKTQLQQQESSKIQNDTTPRCPHCHSTNIKSISGLNRGTSIAMWGIFSKKINKSFECLDCKYTW